MLTDEVSRYNQNSEDGRKYECIYDKATKSTSSPDGRNRRTVLAGDFKGFHTAAPIKASDSHARQKLLLFSAILSVI